MAKLTVDPLRAALERCVNRERPSGLCVAYSGGLDSTVLLHAMARLAPDAHLSLRAAHVDHQLHSDSASWSAHCMRTARALGIECTVLNVDVVRDAESGLEAAAREARYGVLRGQLRAGEALLTAHHADDQLETMLLSLLRGSGVRGLGAMPESQPFGPGVLLRPLLAFTRTELEQWAKAERLEWLEDPSNEHSGFDRNYLRQRILPALRERWPAAAVSASRSTAHVREANSLLDELAREDLAVTAAGEKLSVSRLRALEPARRRNLLRHWIRQRGARVPSSRKLAAIEHDMLNARGDRIPCIDWPGAEVRRYRDLLYCIAPHAPPPCEALEWRIAQPLVLPAGLGRLRMVEIASGGLSAARLPATLDVRFRIGGESFRPAGHAHHRKLKKLLQAAHVLPWWRDRLPLICSGGDLVAVADLWCAEEYATAPGEAGLRIEWEGKDEVIE